MKIKAFASRNIKELMRDPLSYIFCIGFPLVMLLIMTIIGQNIPKEAGLDIFNVSNQSAGTAVFGLAFIMLFAALLISKDRESALLIRLFASPMRAMDFIFGYALPLAVVAVAQLAVNFVSTIIIAAVIGENISVFNLLLSMLIHIPSVVFFIGLGIIFGSTFSANAAPGLCSIIISVAPILGGVWMDIDSMGGAFLTAAKIFPFYHAVKASRSVISGLADGVLQSVFIIALWSVAVFVVSVFVFKSKMRSEKN